MGFYYLLFIITAVCLKILKVAESTPFVLTVLENMGKASR